MRCPFHGSCVALPTPFRGDEIDFAAFERLIDEHVSRGTDGLVVAGSTGEAATLSDAERTSLIHAAVECSAGRVPVIAGVGTNCTRTSVELARTAERCGADGLLAVAPYYNRPSPRGLCLHFGAIAGASGLPLVLYNVPSRTGVDLMPETAAEIAAANDTVVAIKESSPSVERARRLASETDLAVFCGEDALIADFAVTGAVGAISVVGNLAPEAVAELVRAARPGGDPVRAAALVEDLAPLVSVLFVETNPVPVKAALALLGRCRPDVRLPLAPLLEINRRKVEEALAASPAIERGSASAPRRSRR